LKRMEKQVSNYKSFMEDFFGILWSTNLNIFWNGWCELNSKKLLLVFSTDKGFSWNYNNKLFKNICSEYFNDKSNVDIFCIWKKAFEFFAKKWFNIVWYLKLSDEICLEDLSEVYDYLLSSISNNVYWDVSVYLNLYKNKINSKTLNYTVYPLEEDSLSTFVDNFWINIMKFSEWVSLWIESNQFKVEMEKQLLQYMLYWAALQNKVAELKSRISAIQNIKNNSEFVVKDLKLSFNRLCQSLLTREVSNIMELKTTY
jgi:ATP synthase F1 gamma subunit